MIRGSFIAMGALLGLLSWTLAADKAPTKPLGEWTKKGPNATITFKIEATRVIVQLTTDAGAEITADAAYGLTEDGTLFGCITKVDKKGTEAGPEKGDLFSFQYKIDGEKMVVSNLGGTRSGAEAQQLVEGDYSKKK